MKHCLDVNELSYDAVIRLIERALVFKHATVWPAYPRKILANLFYENSTRTRVSFELAAKHLGMSVVNVDVARSSEQKGEQQADTIKTLASMGVDIAVIRHSEAGMPKTLADSAPQNMHVINAGDGAHAHPTQALLDVMTIMEHKPQWPDLKIAVVGDIRHSRVAHSLQALCQLLKMGELVFVGPESWLPTAMPYGRATTSLSEGLAGADVVMTLRVQQERLLAGEHLDLSRYRQDYALTQATLAYAKPDAIVMHPGPLNRGIEIDNDVADGPQSCIWQQVHNGVFMRMAIIEALLV